MSMMGYVLRLPPNAITKLRADTTLTQGVTSAAVQEASDRQYADAIAQMTPDQRDRAGTRRAKMTEERSKFLLGHPELSRQIAADKDARDRALRTLGALPRVLELQKSWHVLHYLFTGHGYAAETPSDALLSGEPIGDDVGYGPARLQTPALTREFNEFLTKQELEALISRLNFPEMTRLGIYPVFGADETSDAWQEEVRYYFPLLRDYVHQTRVEDDGLLIWLS